MRSEAYSVCLGLDEGGQSGKRGDPRGSCCGLTEGAGGSGWGGVSDEDPGQGPGLGGKPLFPSVLRG